MACETDDDEESVACCAAEAGNEAALAAAGTVLEVSELQKSGQVVFLSLQAWQLLAAH